MKEKDLIERMDRMEKAILTGLQMMEALTKCTALPNATATPTYTQAEVALMTGWSIATFNRLVSEGLVEVTPGMGKKCRIPATEVSRILSLKGHGRKARRSL